MTIHRMMVIAIRQKGEPMNHDYAHCADFRSDCPKKCFRGQLVRDLVNHLILPRGVSWVHFAGTEECKRKERRNDG